MINPMDKFNFTQANTSPNQMQMLQNLMQQAMQNPVAFEEQFKKSNPQAYQKALQICNGFNPQQAIAQLAQSKGINIDLLKRSGII